MINFVHAATDSSKRKKIDTGPPLAKEMTEQRPEQLPTVAPTEPPIDKGDMCMTDLLNSTPTEKEN